MGPSGGPLGPPPYSPLGGHQAQGPKGTGPLGPQGPRGPHGEPWESKLTFEHKNPPVARPKLQQRLEIPQGPMSEHKNPPGARPKLATELGIPPKFDFLKIMVFSTGVFLSGLPPSNQAWAHGGQWGPMATQFPPIGLLLGP